MFDQSMISMTIRCAFAQYQVGRMRALGLPFSLAHNDKQKRNLLFVC